MPVVTPALTLPADEERILAVAAVCCDLHTAILEEGADFDPSSPWWNMRRWMLIGMLLVAGCQHTIGPLVNRNREKPDDPYFSIEEQKRRGRDRYSLPDESAGPRTGVDRYGPTGR